MNPVSWTQKRSFYISKLSYEDKNNIYQERKKEDETKEEENKRKYSSYKGTVGKIADNLIERDFNADISNKKWYTDVTEYNLRGEKCYLSPIIDGYNGEVISYNTSKSLNFEQKNDMLIKAIDDYNICYYNYDRIKVK